ncbi:FAD-binding and (Fe-S)-binding domain-containing protein [Plantactinospora endophytica]|uniref:Dimethylmenaquinone methyltransferase n=1 Tax=Plantactinospora endophytica TaxID=673535 RepID=A0ABQ4E729_9ACTN|nr:FAD-binding and (Fe-S)-binding domain-containing protein [Plantactinospora endophytica]GIG90522.1 dimethylmenaquinone methyltransferase [Plantactinospora endophytica]
MGAVRLPDPTVRTATGRDGQAGDLAMSLSERVAGEVRFDPGSRALYATDGSNYRQVPIGVVVPRDPDDVAATVATCQEYGVPVLSRGGGTSLAGQSCNVAVVMDFSKYVNQIESFDPDARTVVVQPGIVLDTLNAQTRRHDNLIFGPKPATHSHCTIGGMIGNDSCGSTAQWSGTTAGNVRRLEILTYDGTRMWVGATSEDEYQRIVAGGGRPADLYRRVRDLRDRCAEQIRRFPRLPRRISGYNLPALLPENGFHLAQALVGSESTCVTVLRAELALLPEPAHKAMVLLGYPDIVAAARAVPEVNRFQPFVLEGIDDKLITFETRKHMHPQALHLLPRSGAWLLVQFGGATADEATGRVDDLLGALARAGHPPVAKVFADVAHEEQIWAVREAALAATARVPGEADTWPGWEDSAVPPEQLGDYLAGFIALLDEFGYGDASLYGHFGDGCLHTSLPFDLITVDGVAAYRAFVERAADLCVSHGGSLSGEHGDGQSRGELLARMYGPEMVSVFEEFKRIFDPDNRMNPGKIVHADPLDEQLRLGPGYAPAEPATHFQYPADKNSFARAANRCVGVGKCRRPGGDGVMCPSYMVTGDEQHSTRGRARLLFEMVRGETVTAGWHDPSVADALDLCLACKGCKRDCPVNVDMATYKAEFLAHHYAGRIRPRDHYSLGWLPVWARLATLAPGTVNAVAHTPGIGTLVKRLGNLDPRRDLPRLSRASFKRWFHRRTPGGSGERGPVLLWPDTFTTYLSPGIGAAAIGVLEAAGFRVVLPRQQVCCGLTWISTGQLGVARRVLRRTLDVLAPYLRDGVPVLGLEPSCTAVFRSDAHDLLGHSLDVERLAGQTKTLAELLTERAPEFTPHLPAPDGRRPRAIVQTHCHQHAVLGFDADTDLMGRVGIDAEVLDSGCCGLAGNFGMTPEHREVSLGCAERVLLPAVRDADPATLVLADGFSCRTQIDDGDTGRRAVHLAEVLNGAVRGTPIGDYPERSVTWRPEGRHARS